MKLRTIQDIQFYENTFAMLTVPLPKEPKKPGAVAEHAHRLPGVGESSRFALDEHEQGYRVRRWSERGDLECDRIFVSIDQSFTLSQPFSFNYPSHCSMVTVLQGGKKVVLTYSEKP